MRKKKNKYNKALIRNAVLNKIVATDKKHLQLLIKQEIKKNGPNCDLNHIDVSNVTDMAEMFHDSQFNGDISKWDVSKATNMDSMFYDSQFNRDISEWDVSNVTDMSWLFYKSKFNQDISNWDVSNVTDMRSMFKNTPNPTRFKWNFEKLLMNLKIEFDVNNIYDSEDNKMFRQRILGIYE
jgi:surface protein